MILSVGATPGALEHRCPACGGSSQIDTSTLVLGVSMNGAVNPDLIRLPACPCGKAASFLLRTWDETPPEFHGSAHDLQRRAVNAVAQELKTKGRSHPDAKALHDGEKAAPPETAEFPVIVRPKEKAPPPAHGPGVPTSEQLGGTAPARTP